MRTIIYTLITITIAGAFAFAIAVFVRQAHESGSFPERVAVVLNRELGTTWFGNMASQYQPEDVTVSDAAVVRNLLGGRCPSDAAHQQLGPNERIIKPDDVVRYSACLTRDLVRLDLDRALAAVRDDAAIRDSADFWSNVEINAVFLMLSFMLPIVFSRGFDFRRARH